MLPISDLAFHHRLGRVMEHIADEGFWPALVSFLRHSIDFDSWVALIFRADRSPQVLRLGDDERSEDILFVEYVRNFYQLDPFYLLSKEPSVSGLYRLDDVAPEHFRKTEYYQNYFALNIVEDEIEFMISLPEIGVLTLSLGYSKRFNDDEVGKLCLYTPWLLPMMKVAAELQIAEAGIVPDQAISLEAQLRGRGTPRLTEREVQTAVLLLAGHSNKAIAVRLRISPETVKVHRRNLYDKLNVSSQAEIFSMFMKKNATYHT